MKVNIINILKNKENFRVEINKNFRELLLGKLNFNEINTISMKLTIHPKTLKRKIEGKSGYSFLYKELKVICDYLEIKEGEIVNNLTKIKTGCNAFWIDLPSLEIDEIFVEGVGYYVGDGRTKTTTKISTVNKEESILNSLI